MMPDQSSSLSFSFGAGPAATTEHLYKLASSRHYFRAVRGWYHDAVAGTTMPGWYHDAGRRLSGQRCRDRQTGRASDWRREGVADLPVSSGLAAGKLPGVGESLEPGHHRDGQ